MGFSVKYLQTLDGKPSDVQIPIKEGNIMLERISILEEKSQLKARLQQALEEVVLMQEGKLPRTTLEEFINEV